MLEPRMSAPPFSQILACMLEEKNETVTMLGNHVIVAKMLPISIGNFSMHQPRRNSMY